MIIESIIIGIIFGTIWGILFTNRYKHLSKANQNTIIPKRVAQFLASTSIIRYLILAIFLGFLLTKHYIDILWWLLGFLPTFWILLISSLQIRSKMEQPHIIIEPSKGKNENSNI